MSTTSPNPSSSVEPKKTLTLAENIECRSTKIALVLNGLFNEPLVVLIGLYAAILVKEFNASAWQISLYTALRPVMALVAFYLTSFMIGRRDRLIPQLLITGILCRLPFFFFPWIGNAWQMIACCAFYLLLSHSGLPAWIEVLKIKLSKKTRGRLFSTGAVLGYLEGLIFAIILGNLLKHEQGSWRWLFPVSAAFGIASLFWQARIPIGWKPELVPIVANRNPWKQLLLQPIADAWLLLKKRRDFRQFQLGFMGCGAAVMLIYAIMPHYFIDQLKVSYKDIALATAFFKAIGYACSSSSWVKRLDEWSIFRASGWIFIFVAIFPLLLLLAEGGNRWALWAAFTVYGIGLAGNHLIWHLSAPLFSAQENSKPFSSVNVLMIGIRGLIFPVLGACVGRTWGFPSVLWISSAMCFIASAYMFLVDCSNGQAGKFAIFHSSGAPKEPSQS